MPHYSTIKVHTGNDIRIFYVRDTGLIIRVRRGKSEFDYLDVPSPRQYYVSLDGLVTSPMHALMMELLVMLPYTVVLWSTVQHVTRSNPILTGAGAL